MARASTDVEVCLAQIHQNPQSGRRSALSGAENNALLAGFLRPLAAFRAAREGGQCGVGQDAAPGPIGPDRGLGHPLSSLLNGQGDPCAEPT